MQQYYYDFHIHSCLSACSDELMTPTNIVNTALKNGLDIIAITDYNSTRNISAAIYAAQGLPLTVIPGVEVITSEEIHVICLFPNCEAAKGAGIELERHISRHTNHPDIFGKQVVLNERQKIMEFFPYLLLSPLDISIDILSEFIESFGGIMYPAHIDKPTNSIISIFGNLPEAFNCSPLEICDTECFFSKSKNETFRENHAIISSSNAHRLSEINRADHYITLEDPTFNSLKKELFSNNNLVINPDFISR